MSRTTTQHIAEVFSIAELINLQYMLRDQMRHAAEQATITQIPEVAQRFIMWQSFCYNLINQIQTIINQKLLCTTSLSNLGYSCTISDQILKHSSNGYTITLTNLEQTNNLFQTAIMT